MWEKEFDKKFKGWKNTKFDMTSGDVEYVKDKSVDTIVVSKKEIKKFIQKEIDDAVKEERERLEQKVGMIRQWLNEDRITDPKKMITSEDLLYFINR